MCLVKPETRSDKQNRLMWALIGDMQAQNDEMRAFDQDDAKLRFMNALGSEMRFLPELWGPAQFPVGQRSSKLNKRDFANLIELMLKWGAENDIRWSTKSKDAAAEHGIELGGER